jgi:hypothetical protein
MLDWAPGESHSALEAAMPAGSAAGPDLSDPPVPAAEEFRFVLDEEAFIEAIEPVPLFLRPVIELLAGY